MLELEPNNRLALSTLGFLGEFQPQWQPLGIEALTRLLNLEPDNLDARAQRAKLYYYQGKFSQALADYGLVVPQTQNPEVLGPAAEAYTYSGDAATGLALFGRYQATGATIRGDRTIAYSQALRESGNLTQAVQVLEAELSRTPTAGTQNSRLRGALATAYAASSQYQAALDVIQPLRGRSDARLTPGPRPQRHRRVQPAAELLPGVRPDLPERADHRADPEPRRAARGSHGL